MAMTAKILQTAAVPSKPRQERKMPKYSALFDSHDDAERAVAALNEAGFSDEDVSIVTSNPDGSYNTDGATAGAGTGAGIGAVAGGLLAGLGLMTIPGVGPVLASGWLASAAGGALAGAVAGGAVGGLIGAMTDDGVSEDDAHVYAEGIRRGGVYVSVRADESERSQIEDIFGSSNRVDPADRRHEYERAGWTRFDDSDDHLPPPAAGSVAPPMI
jgi:uncharacterized membrane protein